MTTERLIAASAVGGFILTLFIGAIAGTFVLGTTFATQGQVSQAVNDGIAPLATQADVVREVGSIRADLADLPTRDAVAALVADAVDDGIAPLATQADVAREVGSIRADLADLPTRDAVAALVADAVKAGIAEVIAPLATKEDLAALAERVETFDAKANALIDCMIDLDGPRIATADLTSPDAPVRWQLPNSCERARDLAHRP